MEGLYVVQAKTKRRCVRCCPLEDIVKVVRLLNRHVTAESNEASANHDKENYDLEHAKEIL